MIYFVYIYGKHCPFKNPDDHVENKHFSSLMHCDFLPRRGAKSHNPGAIITTWLYWPNMIIVINLNTNWPNTKPYASPNPQLHDGGRWSHALGQKVTKSHVLWVIMRHVACDVQPLVTHWYTQQCICQTPSHCWSAMRHGQQNCIVLAEMSLFYPFWLPKMPRWWYSVHRGSMEPNVQPVGADVMCVYMSHHHGYTIHGDRDMGLWLFAPVTFCPTLPYGTSLYCLGTHLIGPAIRLSLSVEYFFLLSTIYVLCTVPCWTKFNRGSLPN
jgi:hypothetical protein